MRRHRRSGLRAALAAALVVAPASAQEPVPAEVTGRLDRLRLVWPQVPRAEMRSGQRFEYRDGTIRVGATTLADLAKDPNNASGVVLDFLLAHEGWHSVQYASRGEQEIERMKLNRMLECEADYMGAAQARRMLPDVDAEAAEAARRSLQAYVRARSGGFGGAAAYPPAQIRTLAVAIGWAQAGQAGFFLRADGSPAPARPEQAGAAAVCEKLVNAGDPSQGALWLRQRDETLNPDPAQGLDRIVDAENRSARPVTASVLAIGRHTRPVDAGKGPGLDDSEVFAVIEDSFSLPPKGKLARTYKLPPYPAEMGDGWWWDLPMASGGPAPHLATSRYEDPEAAIAYCSDNFHKVARAADRAMLARLALIAGAAEDDFRPILGWQSYDTEYGRIVSIREATDPGVDGTVTLPRQGDPSAFVTVFKSEEEDAVTAEFARLKALLIQVCGAQSVVAMAPLPEGPPDPDSYTILRLAPRASVRMNLNLWRLHYQRTGGGSIPEEMRQRGGSVGFHIRRTGGG